MHVHVKVRQLGDTHCCSHGSHGIISSIHLLTQHLYYESLLLTLRSHLATRMHLCVMQSAYLDKGNIWVLDSELHPFWVQCFAGLTPWCEELDCHQLFRLLALLHNFLQHFLCRCKYQVFRTRNFPPKHMHPCWQNCRVAGCRGKHGTCSPHISLCIRNFFFPCFSPTGHRILSLTYGRHLTNNRYQVRIPGLSFLPAPDSIWMHADAIVGRLVDDVCCSYVCSHGSGTTVATSMRLRAAGALQSVPMRYAYLGAQRLYGMVLTQGAGRCNAKHTGNLRFTAVDQRR